MNITNEDATLHELQFLKRLGKWSECGVPRRELLQRYLLTSIQRVRWDGIDPARVRAYAAIEIHTLGD